MTKSVRKLKHRNRRASASNKAHKHGRTSGKKVTKGY